MTTYRKEIYFADPDNPKENDMRIINNDGTFQFQIFTNGAYNASGLYVGGEWVNVGRMKK